MTNTGDKSVTVFPAQDLRVSEPPTGKAQAGPPEVREKAATAQATSGNAGTNFWSNLPVILGIVAAAMVIGAAALVLTARRRSRSKTAEDAATSETPAEDLEGIQVLSDRRQG